VANPAHASNDGGPARSGQPKSLSSVGRDPILRVLCQVPGPRIVLFVGSAILMFGLAASAAWFEDTLWTSSNSRGAEGFLNDFSTVIDFVLLDPLIVLLVVMFHDRIDQALSRPEVLNGGSETRQQRTAIAESWIGYVGHPVWSIIAAVWTPFVMILHVRDRLSLGDSYAGFEGTLVTVTGAMVWLGTSIVVYLVSLGLLKGLVYTVGLWQLGLSPGIRFDITNPDGAGGARLLVRPILTFHWFLIVCGTIVVLFVVHDWYYFDNLWTFRIAISSFFYVVFFPSLFLIPLFVMHGYMTAFRRDFLTRLAARLPVPSRKGPTSAPVRAKDSTRLEDWLAWRDLAKQFPTWPLSVPEVVRWAAIYYAPAIVSVAATLVTDARIGG
jgi:hypothetical protein